eukprot:TRINITY_DN133_c0_g1_i2.p1 TRINITY_DN133_c0_g1~~TRINITY_DN133_c0_g1_i2.p1  ORF type:complete len:343 (+),score=133.40 TRINITY_DN133_c0_g1_i2:82-1110(+)
MTKAHTTLDELKGGAFKRTASAFRNWIKKGSTEFPPVAGRYHLYASYTCPWACRCLAVRELMGLQDAISLSIVHPTWQRTRPDDAEDTHCGWVFHEEAKGPVTSSTGHGSIPSTDATVDHLFGKRTLREIYELSNDTLGKYSVPVLFDKERNTIVNNESSEIIEMFAKEFGEVAKDACPVDLFPADKEAEMREVDEKIYHGLNNGVYRAGFARTQEAYEMGVNDVFETLDWLEERLERSRYIMGDAMTQTDIRAYVTLVRFDPVYVVYFKCNKKMIREYPNLYGFLRDMYQNPRIRSSTNMGQITRHYFTSHPTLNHYAIIPSCSTNLDLPHDRATRSYPSA